MISEPIETFLKEQTASSVTDIFLLVLVVAFLLSFTFAKNGLIYLIMLVI
jgi:hypothetical protein